MPAKTIQMARVIFWLVKNPAVDIFRESSDANRFKLLDDLANEGRAKGFYNRSTHQKDIRSSIQRYLEAIIYLEENDVAREQNCCSESVTSPR